ncbi:protein TAP1-like [Salvia miltiorrhiza]|uniref:protein TAP1-like n=1 Tax=Salvia miltiorrhiza TaxID=226208 RepID=UPI0025AD4BD8|nr:protein TAP1-like [Salvia miltiorrhiza]
MERKNTQVIIVLAILMVMLCISCAVAERELIAVGQCISICVSRCKGSPNYDRCYNGCARGCIPAATTSSFYCNLGCSLHKCGNAANDANQLESCLDECSKVQCKE